MDRQASVFEPTLSNDAKQRATLIERLNSSLPGLSLPVNASDEELRVLLADGTVLCRILNKLKPGSVNEARSENAKNFLAAMDDLGLPRFQISDLEKGSMKIVLECLLTLGAHFMPSIGGISPNTTTANNPGTEGTRWKQLADHFGSGDHGSQGDISPRTYASIVAGGDDQRKGGSNSKFQRALRSPVMAEPSAALIHHVGHKFHEVFQMKQGGYADLPAAKISELMKSNSLDNAPTQSLLSVVNGILDESLDRKNGEIPHRVACLLRKVVQEIERRISTQAEHLRTQNNLFKSREEKYQSRIRVLEALATGTNEQPQVVMNQFQQIKTEKIQADEKKKTEEWDVMKEKDKERKLKEKDVERFMKEKDVERFMKEKDVERFMKEKDNYDREIAILKQELEIARKTHEQRSLKMEAATKGAQQELEEKLKEIQSHLKQSKNRVKELEAYSESKTQQWNKKEQKYQIFTEFQIGALRELRFASQSVRQEIFEKQKIYSEDFDRLEAKIKALQNAAENYSTVLAENQKLHNELQELKGNIRVYCRVRPFLPGQTGKQSTVEYIGDNGELTVTNPAKQGKEGRRSFKFNKVYGQCATQADVYADTRPLIQSVLDGYNVCIFAYGQTGSGKTYTMSGPDKGTEEDWGVNYRALNDLFRISQTRQSTYTYEVGVQMVEIYNEQVRDLLTSDSSQRKLGILSTSQNSGLAVPDASMLPVNSPSDVLELMEIGLKNRARGATAMNERSSRSHSVVTIHVRGEDLKNGASMRGSLHLVDLAGSERVDRSEATGDRLKEAQHINKSLSALGDVIFALAQKSAHVPYRNSKLTQVLQSSLGGQAKTLMFVQLNPDATSFSESLSTLKFAERVSGVELGAARSSKEGRDVRELMEQVASLKDTIAKKDEEIERLQLLKDLKNVYPAGINIEKRAMTTTSRYGPPPPSSPTPNSAGGTTPLRNSIKLSGGRAASDHDNRSETSDKHSANSSPQSVEDLKHHKDSIRQSNSAEADIGQNFSADGEMLGFGDAEYDERLSDVSDSGLSMGTENDGYVESSQFHDGAKSSETVDKPRSAVKTTRPPLKSPKDPSKVAIGMRKSVSGSNLTVNKSSSKRWA